MIKNKMESQRDLEFHTDGICWTTTTGRPYPFTTDHKQQGCSAWLSHSCSALPTPVRASTHYAAAIQDV
jgi:hypothetical protein